MCMTSGGGSLLGVWGLRGESLRAALALARDGRDTGSSGRTTGRLRFAVGGAVAHVFFGADAQVGFFALLVQGVEVLEEGDAPHAAGAGAEAFADEAGDAWIFAREIVADFAEADVEAEADFVVGKHGGG